MNKLPKAIILDLDDTIIADDSVSEQSWKAVCEKYAPLIGINPLELREKIDSVYRAYWADPERRRIGGLQIYQTRRELAAKALIQNNLGDEKQGYEIGDAYTTEKDCRIVLNLGAIETLERLKFLSIPLALVTNGGAGPQRRKIERFHLEHYFKFILIEGEFGFGKPEKRVFEACLKQLQAESATTWMVGDDLQRDIGGAISLGISGIWIDWRQRGLPSNSGIKPARIIGSLAELLDEKG
jgi:putative hydrolase of the HAD superfamily